RLRPVDLHDAAARVAADAERDVQAERAARDGRDLVVEALPLLEPHDRALAVLLLDAGDGELEGGVLLLVVAFVVHGAGPPGVRVQWEGGASLACRGGEGTMP